MKKPGEFIKEAREEKGFTVKDFAIALLTPPENIEKIESDELLISYQDLLKVAALTGKRPKDFHLNIGYDPKRGRYFTTSEPPGENLSEMSSLE